MREMPSTLAEWPKCRRKNFPGPGATQRPPRLCPALRPAQIAAEPEPLAAGDRAVSEPTSTDSQATDLSEARRLDRACNQFETAWRAGSPRRIEDLLGEGTGAERSAL